VASSSNWKATDITHGRLPIRYAYLLILVTTVALTWETDVNQITAYASRVFALYYPLRCVVAFIVARQKKELNRRSLRLSTFAFLAVMCSLGFVFGVPSGGSAP